MYVKIIVALFNNARWTAYAECGTNQRQ